MKHHEYKEMLKLFFNVKTKIGKLNNAISLISFGRVLGKAEKIILQSLLVFPCARHRTKCCRVQENIRDSLSTGQEFPVGEIITQIRSRKFTL